MSVLSLDSKITKTVLYCSSLKGIIVQISGFVVFLKFNLNFS